MSRIRRGMPSRAVPSRTHFGEAEIENSSSTEAKNLPTKVGVNSTTAFVRISDFTTKAWSGKNDIKVVAGSGPNVFASGKGTIEIPNYDDPGTLVGTDGILRYRMMRHSTWHEAGHHRYTRYAWDYFDSPHAAIPTTQALQRAHALTNIIEDRRLTDQGLELWPGMRPEQELTAEYAYNLRPTIAPADLSTTAGKMEATLQKYLIGKIKANNPAEEAAIESEIAPIIGQMDATRQAIDAAESDAQRRTALDAGLKKLLPMFGPMSGASPDYDSKGQVGSGSDKATIDFTMDQPEQNGGISQSNPNQARVAAKQTQKNLDNAKEQKQDKAKQGRENLDKVRNALRRMRQSGGKDKKAEDEYKKALEKAAPDASKAEIDNAVKQARQDAEEVQQKKQAEQKERGSSKHGESGREKGGKEKTGNQEKEDGESEETEEKGGEGEEGKGEQGKEKESDEDEGEEEGEGGGKGRPSEKEGKGKGEGEGAEKSQEQEPSDAKGEGSESGQESEGREEGQGESGGGSENGEEGEGDSEGTEGESNGDEVGPGHGGGGLKPAQESAASDLQKRLEEEQKRLESEAQEATDAADGSIQTRKEYKSFAAQAGGFSTNVAKYTNTNSAKQFQDPKLVAKIEDEFRQFHTGFSVEENKRGRTLSVGRYIRESRTPFDTRQQNIVERNVAFMLDGSGSTGSVINDYIKAVMNTADALDRLDVEFSIYGFTNGSVYEIKNVDEEWADSTRRRLAGFESGGGTPMAEAYGGIEGKIERQNPGVIFTLTDGDPADYDDLTNQAPDTSGMVQRYQKKYGIKMVGFNFGGPTAGEKLRHIGYDAVYVLDPRKMDTQLAPNVVKLLVGEYD